MIKKVGFLGFGKIGKALYHEIVDHKLGEVVFVQCLPECFNQIEGLTYIQEYEEELYKQTDLIIECAKADVLSNNITGILKYCDLLPFSLTAFSEASFEKQIKELSQSYGHHVYVPHGAILGLDGIMDGASIWDKVTIETVKNPDSLGRKDTEVTVLYDGTTRGACKEYPRNVNVHAAVALTGIGFDRTYSRIISDPSVHSNTHIISLDGSGVHMELKVSSFADGGVTGKYTPMSACGSVRRILEDNYIRIV